MNIVVLGSGMMGRAIAYDLCKYSQFDKITVVDHDEELLHSTSKFFETEKVNFCVVDIKNSIEVRILFDRNDVAISAIPYKYNFKLSQIAVKAKTHFLDLGGNNVVVDKQRSLSEEAKKQGVTIIPDCGLAPGFVSTITRDIVERMDTIDYVKIRVGGLPVDPKPPLNYQIVFSPNGLINEYIEDAEVLDHGKIIKKKSMTEIETIRFPGPFGEMEAFITSGGCSSLPQTYKNKISYLDYKTIRYPGHCEKFKILLDLGFGNEESVQIGYKSEYKYVVPRELLIKQLMKHVPSTGQDVVLLKVFACGYKKANHDKKTILEYTMIDYSDQENDISAMMRTTGYPVSVTAQMIENGTIKQRGAFCSEEVVSPNIFFKELKRRGIDIKIKESQRLPSGVVMTIGSTFDL